MGPFPLQTAQAAGHSGNRRRICFQETQGAASPCSAHSHSPLARDRAVGASPAAHMLPAFLPALPCDPGPPPDHLCLPGQQHGTAMPVREDLGTHSRLGPSPLQGSSLRQNKATSQNSASSGIRDKKEHALMSKQPSLLTNALKRRTRSWQTRSRKSGKTFLVACRAGLPLANTCELEPQR